VPPAGFELAISEIDCPPISAVAYEETYSGAARGGAGRAASSLRPLGQWGGTEHQSRRKMSPLLSSNLFCTQRRYDVCIEDGKVLHSYIVRGKYSAATICNWRVLRSNWSHNLPPRLPYTGWFKKMDSISWVYISKLELVTNMITFDYTHNKVNKC
jgi:hypothetical protein